MARAGSRAKAGDESESPPELPDALLTALEKRDLRTVAWDYLSHLRLEADFTKSASTAATMMRVILATGEEPADRSEKLEEMAVIGGILNGIPPRDDAHWAIAERLFEPGTIAELRKWTPSVGWYGHPGEPDRDGEEDPPEEPQAN